MPLLSRRCAAEKSSLRSLNALPSKAFRAFDPMRKSGFCHFFDGLKPGGG